MGKQSLGFFRSAPELITTISPNNPHNFRVEGFLYVPEFITSNPCDNSTRALIPSNVTTRTDLAVGGRWSLIALAPWTEPDCVAAYLAMMRADRIHAALFFQPGDDTAASGRPPAASDPSWSLQDGGQWKSVNEFPVYAIPGTLGSILLNQMALYSGNLSQTPHAQELAELYDPHDVIRLYAGVEVTGSGGIPSLWVFLIIVLAILLTVVLVTSVIMHVVQRKQRTRLQRRVANGEVDLEALGIKRLNVPQDLLDKMPQYTYTSQTEQGQAAQGEANNAGQSVKPRENPTTKGAPSDVAGHEVHFSQRTCPICLDDFVQGETTVRELPCNHIFHPECIDPFLRNNSSLCPMCKKSALPPGYCPVQVTNLMVRRERLIRRTRESNSPEAAASSTANRLPAPIAALTRHIRRLSTPQVPRPNPYGSAAGAHVAGSEMHTMPPRSETLADNEMPEDVRAQGVAAQRAWRRERVARQQTRTYDEQANQARALDVSRPLCKFIAPGRPREDLVANSPSGRRILGRIFPSLE